MQGTLNEIDIRSILQIIALGQRTGELFVETYPDLSSLNPQSWFIFFVNGQIVYTIAPQTDPFSRLKDYLHYYTLSSLPSPPVTDEVALTSDPEYAYLWLLLEEKKLNPDQACQIIEKMIQETLFDLLSLHHGSFIFELGNSLTPQLNQVAIISLLSKTVKQVQKWKQFYPHIQKPEQCLKIVNATQLKATLPPKVYRSLVHWADGKTSLRQLSRYINRDIFTLGKGLYPYLQRGWLQLTYPQSETFPKKQADPFPSSRPKIVCIDDDLTVGQTLKTMLADTPYTLTVINHPLEALSQLFSLKPDLILCDIAMPDLDGYEICRMIRHSHTFHQTPIIMLTGLEGFMDRVRARMSGATDYLTKPFGKNELFVLLEQYV